MSMFTMSQHPYVYPTLAHQAPPPPPPRQYSGHGTSSAFSASANPDEDWTKISDLAERRRIQNRIAQRNYRKKLKRRLEDLERRAGSSDEAESDKQMSESPSNASSRTASTSTKRTSSVSSTASSKSNSKSQPPMVKAPQGQFTPPMENSDDLMFASPYDSIRERSNTPPMFTYSTYPAPDDQLLMNPYNPVSQSYAPAAMTTADGYPPYLAATGTVPSTLPSMTHFSDAVKRDSYPSDDSMNPYVSYGFIPGGVDVTVGVPSPYDQSNPHTPPLSHSFDHSTSCSDAGYEYPTTPLSMPPSPPGTISPQQL